MKPNKLSFALMLVVAVNCSAVAQVMTRIAGTPGTCGNTGDGGPAKSAAIAAGAITTDHAGNIYFTDWGNNVIRKISPAGIITKFAGDGTNTHTGDNGPAIAAGIGVPAYLNADNSGNLYVCQFNPHTIVRKISSSGIITTVAGNDTAVMYYGDGVPATSAGFSDPNNMVADSHGNVYIANSGTIKKVNNSGIIVAFAGGGTLTTDGIAATSASLVRPFSLTIDDSDNIFFADAILAATPPAFKIKKIDKNGIINTYAGGGSDTTDNVAAASALINTYWLTATPGGEIFFVDNKLHKIRKISKAGIVTNIAGTGTSGTSGDSVIAATAQINTDFSMISYDRTGNNLYFSEIKSSDPCIGLTTIWKISNVTEKADNISNQHHFVFSPNPSAGVFSFTSDDQITQTKLVIRNAIGQIMAVRDIVSGTTLIDLTSEPNGIYFATIVGSDGAAISTHTLLKHE